MISAGFWGIIATQAVWFLLVTYLCGNGHRTMRFFLFGLLLGLPYGLVMDSFVGYRAGVFSYRGLENSLTFLALNGALSYGLAISTMVNFVHILESLPKIDRKVSYFFLVATSGSLLLYSRLGGDIPLLDMFLLGLVIMSLADLVLVFTASRSVILGSLVSLKGVGLLLIFCATTGLIYEVANSVFDLWAWRNSLPSAEVNLALVILFGYFVLLFPMLVLAYLFSSALRIIDR